MDWSQVLTLVVAVAGATWALHGKLSTIAAEVQALRAELVEKLSRLEGRVVVLEEARKAVRRGRR